MHGDLFRDDLGNYYIFSEESSSGEIEALKRRQEECIQEGGIFFPVSNQCCDSSSIDPKWTPGTFCSDPIERKRAQNEGKETRRMIYIGAGVGALALVAGLWWWLR